MLKNLEELVLNNPAQKGKLMTCFSQVNKLTSQLGPYFDVVAILVQANPEYAGVAWGALRLIFVVQWSSITPNVNCGTWLT
jgi:hypothetical protein